MGLTGAAEGALQRVVLSCLCCCPRRRGELEKWLWALIGRPELARSHALRQFLEFDKAMARAQQHRWVGLYDVSCQALHSAVTVGLQGSYTLVVAVAAATTYQVLELRRADVATVPLILTMHPLLSCLLLLAGCAGAQMQQARSRRL